MSAYRNVVMAGFGGQGVMLIGNLLAQAAMEYGMHVTFVPAYGAEMRGGTANCTVIFDSEPVGSPVVRRPLSLVALNRPSLEKFQPQLAEGGVQIVNSSLVAPQLVDGSVRSVLVPANETAAALGNPRLLNMVMLGAWIGATDALPLEVVQEALKRVISDRYAGLIPANAAALEGGRDFALKAGSAPVSAPESVRQS
jgi:2-oxoglutarate ferredoxin oxidoreductase subunit gamma